MCSNRSVRWVQWGLMLATLLVSANTALAFKSKNHVIIANRVLAELASRSGDIIDDDLRTALDNYPEYFRAGTLGPDNFPDMIAGQVWVHVDNGAGAVVPGTKLEKRAAGEWRSIDYGMYLLMRAREEILVDEEEGRKALAFAYGYLGHMVGDGFSHSYVNEFTSGAWSLTKGSGLFGQITEEVKHYAVEGLLDGILPTVTDLNELTIAVPRDFLYKIMTEEIHTTTTLDNHVVSASAPVAVTQGGPAGSFAGIYYEKLVEARDELRALSDHANWTGTDLFQFGLTVTDLVHDIASPGINPVADIEGFFEIRADMLDTILEEWIWLNECIAQNIVLGSNRRAGDPAVVDACKSIEFEPFGSDLYDGDLNDAAWGTSSGAGGYDDPGSVANNLGRMVSFLKVAVGEFLSFDPARDIASVATLDALLNPCTPVLEWGTCEDACDLAVEACTAALCVTKCTAAAGSFDPWLISECVNCAFLGDEIGEITCGVATHAASPACKICTEHPFCEVVDKIEEVLGDLNVDLKAIVDSITAPIEDALINFAVDTLLGEHAQDFYDGLAILKMATDDAGAIWFVNLVFLEEDLRAGGVDYLRTLLSDAFNVPLSALEGFVAAEDMATATFHNLPNKGAWGDTEAEQEQAFTDFVRHLDLLAKQTNCDLSTTNPAFWLNRIPGIGGTESRAVVLARLIQGARMLMLRPGPTATKLLSDMTATSVDPSNAMNLTTDLWSFPPTSNAIFATVQSLVDPGTRDASARGDRYSVDDPNDGDEELDYISQICLAVPHLLCDGIASLDDPNNQGAGPAAPLTSPVIEYDPQVVFGNDGLELPEWGRSVQAWRARPVVWRRDHVGPVGRCSLGYTAYTPAVNEAQMENVYLGNMIAPNDCGTPLDGCTLSMHHGREYWYCSEVQEWEVARDICAEAGLELAGIEDQAENEFVTSLLPNPFLSMAWLGANDLDERDSWEWQNESQFWQGGILGESVGGRYENWSFIEPNLGMWIPHCARLNAFSGRWNADRCAYEHPFVCETPSPQPSGAPGPDCTFASHDGHDYWFCRSDLDRDDAQRRCVVEGMSLVQIDDAAENGFIQANIRRDAWLGATDGAVEGQWLWDGGDAFWQGTSRGTAVGGAYENWQLFEPNDFFWSQDCAVMRKDTASWGDTSCGGSFDYVCEMEPVDVTAICPAP